MLPELVHTSTLYLEPETEPTKNFSVMYPQMLHFFIRAGFSRTLKPAPITVQRTLSFLFFFFNLDFRSLAHARFLVIIYWWLLLSYYKGVLISPRAPYATNWSHHSATRP